LRIKADYIEKIFKQ